MTVEWALRNKVYKDRKEQRSVNGNFWKSEAKNLTVFSFLQHDVVLPTVYDLSIFFAILTSGSFLNICCNWYNFCYTTHDLTLSWAMNTPEVVYDS